MPHVINGFGTWYWGKRNVFIRRGGCEACGNVGDLQSYDTGKYLVALFIPILPLGTKRIVDQCPACKRHRAMRLTAWEQIKTNELNDNLQALTLSPGDRQVALKAIGTVAHCQDGDSLRDLGEVIERNHAHDAEVMAALGEANDFFGRLEEAERLLRLAIDRRPDEATKTTLARHLLTSGRAAEGADLVRALLEHPTEEVISLGYLATVALQETGDHPAALQLMERMAEVAPEESDRPDLQRLRRISQKDGGRGKKIRSKITHAKRGEKRQAAWRWWLPAAIPPVVIAGSLTVYLWAAWNAGENRPVHVVNGLNRAYDVKVGDATVHLPAHGRRTVRVKEGVLPVKILDQALNIADQTVTIQTPFWSRPFLDRTYIINPDHLAIVIWEKTPYSSQPQAGSQAASNLYVGQALHEFRGIDFEFQPYPASIDVSSSTQVIYRTRVSAESQLSMRVLLGWVGPQIGVDRLREHAMRAVTIEPENSECFAVLRVLTPPSEMIDFVKPMLARRPTLVEAHRSYQIAQQTVAPEHDLIAEYRSLLQASPDDRGLMYLLGRLVPDAAESGELHLRAVSGDTPAGRAHGALAFKWLAQGRFDEALEAAEKAVAMMPDATDVAMLREEALLANGRFLELLQASHFAASEEEMDAWTLGEKAYLHEQLHQPVEANRIVQVGRVMADSQVAAEIDRAAVAPLAYARGDMTEFLRIMEQFDDADARMHVALATGKLDGALGLLTDEMFDGDATAALCVFVAAMHTGRMEIASASLAKAVAALETGDPTSRRAALWLSGTAPAADEALLADLNVSLKKVLLVALGQIQPERRSEYFALARHLCFDARYPHLLLMAATEGGADEPIPQEAGERAAGSGAATPGS